MLSGEHGVPVIGGEYSGCKRSSSHILERLGQQGWVGGDSKHSIRGMVSSFVYQALGLPGAALHTLHA